MKKFHFCFVFLSFDFGVVRSLDSDARCTCVRQSMIKLSIEKTEKKLALMNDDLSLCQLKTHLSIKWNKIFSVVQSFVNNIRHSFLKKIWRPVLTTLEQEHCFPWQKSWPLSNFGFWPFIWDIWFIGMQRLVLATLFLIFLSVWRFFLWLILSWNILDYTSRFLESYFGVDSCGLS